jgi:hypothetical protein
MTAFVFRWVSALFHVHLVFVNTQHIDINKPNICNDIYIYIYIYIYVCIHTYIHAYMHTYI